MSGGAYDYLYGRDPGDGYDRNVARALSHRLRELGYYKAADQLDSIYLRQPSNPLRNLMREVEWMDSGDTGIERVREVAAENGYEDYREV